MQQIHFYWVYYTSDHWEARIARRIPPQIPRKQSPRFQVLPAGHTAGCRGERSACTTPFSAIRMAGLNKAEKGSLPKRSCNACTPAVKPETSAVRPPVFTRDDPHAFSGLGHPSPSLNRLSPLSSESRAPYGATTPIPVWSTNRELAGTLGTAAL